jgi:ABC-2 type transport system permease protein
MDNATRPMLWSIRRELWENRSVYLAPLIVAAVVLFGSLFATMTLPKRVRAASTEPAKLAAALKPFQIAPAPIMLATFIVGFFFALDALYGERRDRSILFWKSMPVSDRTTVLSKAAIPLIVLPLIAFVLSVAVVFVLLFVGTLVLAGHGLSAARLWPEVMSEPLVMFYGLTVHTLWFAPIYCWLLLISAWAKRAPFLWALLPPFAIGAAERMATGASRFGRLMKYRVTGAMDKAFVVDPRTHDITGTSPVEFLLTPGLWLGLAFAAGCLVAATRLRRNREPI